ncbi:MAG TPA: lipid biosynthesis B12-binding/radical SAM protein [Candidatus Brocadiaceae bacterium]|nr:lipid biosynthesis B12-binding/radical SAM protein [Candidatus Brocadiaceae bacterium]
MKILLISANNERHPYPVAPIGIAYIAKALQDKGHAVRLTDLCFVEDGCSSIAKTLHDFNPDVIGISIRNIDNLTYHKSVFYMPEIRRIVDFLKTRTSASLVVGGSGFSIFPEEVLRYLELETGIVGEGETAFVQLLDVIENGGSPDHIQNLCYIKDGKFNSNGVVYNQFNSKPDRSLLNNGAYLELGGMANIQSKRGCPFKCSYCTYPGIEGAMVRLRRPADVAEELKEMRLRYGIDYVFFVDDVFNFPEEHAVEVCEEIIKHDVKINWTCFATPKGMTPKLAALMKLAGCKGIEFGSDAGAEKTLRGLNKHFTPGDIAYADECCREIDLPHAHYIILGGPEEDCSTLKETFSLFEKIKPTAIIALLGLRIYPNTRLHGRAIADGIIGKDKHLLEPTFYLSPKIDTDAVFQHISAHAKKHRNWIVPGFDVRCDANTLTMLRKMGKKGPLWDVLS